MTVSIRDVYRRCELVQCQPGSKRIAAGSPAATLTDEGNKAVKNGTGGILTVDVDPRNGGSVEQFYKLFPELEYEATFMVRTVTGNGHHLVFTIPEDVTVRPVKLWPGIEVTPFTMFPGSVVKGRRYEVVSEVPPLPAAPGLVAQVHAPDTKVQVPVEQRGETIDVDGLLQRFRECPPGTRYATYMDVCYKVLGVLGVEEGCEALRSAYPGDDAWFEVGLRNAAKAFRGGGPGAVEVSTKRNTHIEELLSAARLGVGYGSTNGAANDRRVLVWLIHRCLLVNELHTDVYYGAIANGTGIHENRVRESVTRLEAANHIVVRKLYPAAKLGETGYGLYRCCILSGKITSSILSQWGFPFIVLPYTVQQTGSMSPIALDQNTVSAMSPGWLALGGATAVVYDQLCVLAPCRIRDVTDTFGLPKPMVSRAKTKLVDAGLVSENGNTLDVTFRGMPPEAMSKGVDSYVSVWNRSGRDQKKSAETVAAERPQPPVESLGRVVVTSCSPGCVIPAVQEPVMVPAVPFGSVGPPPF